MKILVLTDEVVAPEREVVLEERRMHCDSDPGAQLNEAVQAALFTQHPYGVPIIGWSHEIEGLDGADALAYYRPVLYAGKRHSHRRWRCRGGRGHPSGAKNIYGPIAARGEPPKRFARRSRTACASSRDALRRKSRAAHAVRAFYLVPPIDRRARRGRGARSSRASAWRRPHQPLVQDAGHGGENRGYAAARIIKARRSMTRASLSSRCPRQGLLWNVSTPRSMRVIDWSPHMVSKRRMSGVPKRGLSPTRSMHRTIRRRLPVGTALHWRPASALRMSRNGPSGSRR